MFVLPPATACGAQRLHLAAQRALARVNVDADGGVMLDLSVGAACSPTGEWVSLEGITFRAV